MRLTRTLYARIALATFYWLQRGKHDGKASVVLRRPSWPTRQAGRYQASREFLRTNRDSIARPLGWRHRRSKWGFPSGLVVQSLHWLPVRGNRLSRFGLRNCSKMRVQRDSQHLTGTFPYHELSVDLLPSVPSAQHWSMPNQPSLSPAESLRRLWWSQPSRRNGSGKGPHNPLFSAPACLRLASLEGRRSRRCSMMEVILPKPRGISARVP